MTTVALSPKFQIVIPKAVREALKLVQGQRLEVRVQSGAVVLEPVIDIRSLRGYLPLIDGVDMSDIPNDEEGPTWPGGCDPIPDAFWVKSK